MVKKLLAVIAVGLVYKASKDIIAKYDLNNVENQNKKNIFNGVDLDAVTYKTVKKN